MDSGGRPQKGKPDNIYGLWQRIDVSHSSLLFKSSCMQGASPAGLALPVTSWSYYQMVRWVVANDSKLITNLASFVPRLACEFLHNY